MWGALSDERTGLSFTVAAGSRQRILGSQSRGTHDHRLLSQIPDYSNGGVGWLVAGHHIYIHKEQEGSVIPLGTEFTFVSPP
jgi:hypothetical protein